MVRDSISIVDVLETYGELYDVFEDNKFIRIELDKVYDKLNGLKEQEAKAVEHKVVEQVPRTTEVKGICPHCKSIIVFQSGQFCDKCGGAVKWE